MRLIMLGLLGAVLFWTTAQAGKPGDDLFVRKKSPHGVAETIDRLAAGVEAGGATVFARIDHAQGAGSIGESLKPSQVLIFGNPRLGTPLMQSAPEIAIDLPMKALAYEDEAGQVWILYLRPAALKARYGIEDRDPVFDRMATALDRLTSRAVADGD